jgi:tRNA1Val (adenine37-N6)-methyltransferase
MPPKAAVVDPVLGPLTRDVLTRDFVLWQRRAGHRFSVDDMATAWLACEVAETYLEQAPSHVLDLGCGIGSVLVHLAWNYPNAVLLGVEAQDSSYALLQRNIDENRLAARATGLHADLRSLVLPEAFANQKFPLITGTPPYFPGGTALDATDSQRTFARMEYRGGIEAYVLAAAPLLWEDGVLVLCCDTGARNRATSAAAAAALHLVREVEVIPKAGKAPLFSVWAFRFRARADGARLSSLLLRDAEGNSTEDARMLKKFSGLV